MTGVLGLRERKKAAARLALHEAALRLAIERGLDSVTTEAIADAADLSRRTFSNYFSGKEEAILYNDQVQLDRLLELVRERPPEEPAWTALRRSVRQLDAARSFDRDRVAAIRLMRRHPALMAHQAATYTAFELEITAALAEREAGEASARVLAAALLAGLRLGTVLWLEDQDAQPLGASVERVLDQIGARFD